MNSCVCQNVRKHREIKNGEICIALDISLKYGCLDKMEITFSEKKYDQGRLEKQLIKSLGLNTIEKSKKKKKGKVCHYLCQYKGSFKYYQEVWKFALKWLYAE